MHRICTKRSVLIHSGFSCSSAHGDSGQMAGAAASPPSHCETLHRRLLPSQSAPCTALHLLALTVLESGEAQKGQDNLIKRETVQRLPTRLLKISATTMTIQSQVRPFQEKRSAHDETPKASAASSGRRLRRGFGGIPADARALVRGGCKVVPSLQPSSNAKTTERTLPACSGKVGGW